MSKFNKIYNFVLADRNMAAEGGSFSFRSYTDRVGVFGNPGSEVMFNDGTRDRHGRPQGKSFAINQSHYNLQAREGQSDVDGKKLYEFFFNAPFTEGSPNGTYIYADGGFADLSESQLKDRNTLIQRLRSGELVQIGVKIKLLDNAMDAKIVLETNTKRAKAELSVSELDADTLKDVAALMGIYGDPDEFMRQQVQDRARKRPIEYFKMLESGDRAVRAIVRKSIENRTFYRKGEVIMWENTVIGANEDDAVSKLLHDQDMLEALQSKSALQTDIKIPKKPGPKPKAVAN